MKILFLILDHHSAKQLSIACQQTWMRDIRNEHDVIFIGDPKMPSNIGSHEVYIPLLDEKVKDQSRITEKMVCAFKYIADKDWDFLLRVDVDVYCNVEKLEEYIKTLPKHTDHYIGQGIHFPKDKHPNYLSNVSDQLPPKQYKYYYAQGGCYLLNKSALMKSLNEMYYPAPIEPRAEDIMVGDALAKAGVSLNDRPDLFNCGYVGRGWPNMGTRKNTKDEHIKKITKEGYISTHKIDSNLIYEIHNRLKNDT